MKRFLPIFCHVILMVLATSQVGCTSKQTLPPVPEAMLDEATIPGMPKIRTWGDRVDPWFVDSLADSVRQYHAYLQAHPDLEVPATADILAISGGGSDGAYGAGLLCGWTARGDRPEFRVVTGVSTGALIAPLAFLGSEYDHVLKQAYTTVTEPDVAIPRSLLALLTEDGMYDTDPLYELITEWIDDEAIAAIAAEHAKGRRLLVGTVNLEAQRPVIWDLGAIASCGHPDAPRLLRQVMLASASIPAAFEPQYFKVEAGGETYREVHVDGGTFAQVFLFGGGVNLNSIVDRAQKSGLQAKRRPVRIFILRNAQLAPEYAVIKPKLMPITGRAISTLIKSQGTGDLYRLYLVCQAEEMQFNLASIPLGFKVPSESMFDPIYMSALFEVGYQQASTGYPWQDSPPHLKATLEADVPSTAE